MIELAEVISNLRLELDRARRAVDDADLLFELGPIDLEVTVALEKQGGAGARVRFWVADLAADTHITATTTNRIKLTLQPIVAAAADHQDDRASVYVGSEADDER